LDKACSSTKDPVTGVAETIDFVVDRYDLDHTFGTGTGIPGSTSMTRITAAVSPWIDRQLA